MKFLNSILGCALVLIYAIIGAGLLLWIFFICEYGNECALAGIIFVLPWILIINFLPFWVYIAINTVFLYTIGYIIQKIYTKLKDNKKL